MTETIDTSGSTGGTKKRSGGLSTMLVADLKAMAGGLGISGAGSMKKPQLIEAIKGAQSGGGAKKADRPDQADRPDKADRGEQADRGDKADRADRGDKPAKAEKAPKHERAEARAEQASDQTAGDQGQQHRQQQPAAQSNQPAQRSQNQGQSQSPNQTQSQTQTQTQDLQDGDGGSRRNRRRRGRDRERTPNQQGNLPQQGGQQQQQQPQQRNPRNEPDTTILDDDILVPAAGILDVLDNYAFVRTSGYLPGAEDVYVSLSMVRKYGLRRGDAIVGQVRQPREGERKEKFNPMVRIDAVNGADPDASRHRAEFGKLTALAPEQRLRLETGADNLVGRAVDVLAPIGKGTRGLVVAPPSSGKTVLLKSIASAITANNPECHLMVVLIDERPEEVTDFERTVKGEVISSTFERPAADHTTLAELAIERAKRLVELGHDVVVLLDGLSRLGRAYNATLPSSGRVLAGGIDAAALHAPKKFFGAARNIENGGSLTVLATALVETGSEGDEAVLEEFAGTETTEIRLRRDLADRRLYPALDTVRSGTRREEELMSGQELEIVWKLRRTLADLDPREALESVLGRLRSTQTNIEFLRQVQAD